jgi:putative DNA primase/helicase
MSGEDEIARQVTAAKEAAEAKKDPGHSRQQKRQADRKEIKRRRAFPFKNEAGQLWREVETEGDGDAKSKRWVQIGSELHVLALTRSAEGEDWGRLVEVIDRDGAKHLWAVPQSLHAGSGEAIFSELLRLGWEPAPGRGRKWRDDLRDMLMCAEPDKRVRCVVRIGWNGEAYVLPDGAISAAPSAEEVILQASERIDHALNVSGDLAGWQTDVAAKALGNSRLVLALSAAFAAPLLAVTGDDGGGFHFRGASSSGKSTALAVAGSVWGGGGTRGYVQSWRATDNGLEALSALHNDCLLCLDELSQIDSKAAGQAAYMLGNGVGKARAGREGQARKSHEWRLLFLSNGEMGLADKISEAGGRIAAGIEVRVIDLRADAGAGLGIFENLHGAPDPATFAQSLKAAAARVYGVAARAFLRHITADLAEVRESVSAARKAFLAAALPSGADGQVRRVADRFALVAAAGELATAQGVTGWPESAALEAALRCFRDWLAERGGIGASEVSQAKAMIRREIEVNGHSRFLPWRPDARTVVRTNALGYVQRADEEQLDSAPIFYFHASGMKEVLAGLDRKTVLEGLAAEGVIVRHEVKVKGEPRIELTKIFKVPSEKTGVRLYQIDFAALTAEASEADG